jgi:hypothetical protein
MVANLKDIPGNDIFSPKNMQRFEDALVSRDLPSITPDEQFALDDQDIALGNTMNDEETSLVVRSALSQQDPFEPTIDEAAAVEVAATEPVPLPPQDPEAFTVDPAELQRRQDELNKQFAKTINLSQKALTKKERGEIGEKLRSVNEFETQLSGIERLLTEGQFSFFNRVGVELGEKADFLKIFSTEEEREDFGALQSAAVDSLVKFASANLKGVLSDQDIARMGEVLGGAISGFPQTPVPFVGGNQPSMDRVQGALRQVRQGILLGRARMNFLLNTGQELTEENLGAVETVPQLIRDTAALIEESVLENQPDLDPDTQKRIVAAATANVFGLRFAADLPPGTSVADAILIGNDLVEARAELASQIPSERAAQAQSTQRRRFNPETGKIE